MAGWLGGVDRRFGHGQAWGVRNCGKFNRAGLRCFNASRAVLFCVDFVWHARAATRPVDGKTTRRVALSGALSDCCVLLANQESMLAGHATMGLAIHFNR